MHQSQGSIQKWLSEIHLKQLKQQEYRYLAKGKAGSRDRNGPSLICWGSIKFNLTFSNLTLNMAIRTSPLKFVKKIR